MVWHDPRAHLTRLRAQGPVPLGARRAASGGSKKHTRPSNFRLPGKFI